MRVVGVSFGEHFPVLDEFVLEAVLVGVEAVEEFQALGGDVVIEEGLFLALGDQWIAIGIALILVMLTEILAHSEFFEAVVDGQLGEAGIALSVLCDLFGVEVWHALTADEAGEDILVTVDHGVEALIGEHLD